MNLQLQIKLDFLNLPNLPCSSTNLRSLLLMLKNLLWVRVQALNRLNSQVRYLQRTIWDSWLRANQGRVICICKAKDRSEEQLPGKIGLPCNLNPYVVVQIKMCRRMQRANNLGPHGCHLSTCKTWYTTWNLNTKKAPQCNNLQNNFILRLNPNKPLQSNWPSFLTSNTQ